MSLLTILGQVTTGICGSEGASPNREETLAEDKVVVHEHTLSDGVRLRHAHPSSGLAHSHDTPDARVGLHEHSYPGGLRLLHAHSANELAHTHGPITCEQGRVQLIFPPSETLRDLVFQRWAVPHPICEIFPVWQVFPGHAKAHFDSSGMPDYLSGALTLLTQGFKVVVGLGVYMIGNAEWVHHGWNNAARVASACVGAAMFGAWWRWCDDMLNNFVSITAWLLYIYGWMLSVEVLYDRLETAFGIPRYCGLFVACGPPLYISVRTALFFPSAKRRQRFLLAALSNRSMPISMNCHVVGPEATLRTHRFLVLLNTYSLTATLSAKLFTFAVAENMGALDAALHAAHLLTTAYSVLLAIRLRQVALDAHAAAKTTEEDIAVICKTGGA